MTLPKRKRGGAAHRKSIALGTFHEIGDSFQRALFALRQPPEIRAQDPFSNHPWVFAAAMTIATVAAQAPFVVYRETPEFFDARMQQMRAKHGALSASKRYGNDRRAVQRHIAVPIAKRLARKGLEPDWHHPIYDLLLRPNPYQVGNQLFQTTYMWLAVRGECFWVMENALPGALPTSLWPMSPDMFTPLFEGGSFGPLDGWRFALPPYMRRGTASSGFVDLELSEVIQFKLPNPGNLLRGMSLLAAVASTVELDLRVRDRDSAILENGGDPGGFITSDMALKTEESREILREFEQRHKGSRNARRTALLQAGLKYTPAALTPAEMEHQETRRWNREEILAVMRTPQSVLGITDFINYATQLGQDKNLWDKNLIPLGEVIERTLDATLFFEQPDEVVGAFDYKNVEALRAGLQEQMTVAKGFCGPELHMPPRVAFETLGLEIDDYEASDKALVPPLLSTVEAVVAGSAIIPPTVPGAVPGAPTAPGAPGAPAPTLPPAEADPDDEFGGVTIPQIPQLLASVKRLEEFKASRHAAFLKVQERLERDMARRYRAWVRDEKADALSVFDRATKSLSILDVVTKAVPSVEELLALLKPIRSSQNKLKLRVWPLYTSALEQTFEMTAGEFGGVPTFELDDPSIMRVLDQRAAKFVGSTPVTLRKNIASTLRAAIQAGETVQEMRVRLAQVHDVAAGSAKTLSVARTETAGFMNSVRDEMFGLQGFTKQLWTTSKDEHVRDTHVKFGAAGPQARGFNFLTLVGKAGKLAFPGDPEAPAGEVINCRCSAVPVG